MTDHLKDRIRAHYHQLESLQSPIDLEAIPQELAETSLPASSPIRRFPALAMGLTFAAILSVALAIIWLADGTEPADLAPPSPEELAIESVQAWAEGIRNGDLEAAVELVEEGSMAEIRMTPEGRLGWLLAIASESSLGPCEAEATQNSLNEDGFFRVTCPWTISDPISAAIDVETADLTILVDSNGKLVQVVGVGDRWAWKDVFVDYATANYESEFNDACLPFEFDDERFLGHALSARCGEFYMNIASEVAASVE